MKTTAPTRGTPHSRPVGELTAAMPESEEPPEPSSSPQSAEIAALYAQKQRLIEMLNGPRSSTPSCERSRLPRATTTTTTTTTQPW